VREEREQHQVAAGQLQRELAARDARITELHERLQQASLNGCLL
jgi:hypothetical protein